jgi:tetratricopeptide (TPR) repeat protein
VRAALDQAEELAPVPAGDLSRALENLLPARSLVADQLGEAAEALARAGAAFTRFDYDAALAELAVAEQALLAAPPEPAVMAALADLSFQAGLIHVAADDTARALRAFRAVRRLDPERSALDPARYPPSVVELYDQSARPVPASGRIRVSAPYDGTAIHLDGVDAGTTPLEIPAAPGIHYVHASYPDHRVWGARVEMAGPQAEVKVRLERMTVDERGRELRRRALDGAPWAEAARAAAALTGVDAVVLIRGTAGKLETALFDANRGRLSDWRAADVEPGTLVAPLVPPPPVAELPPEQPPIVDPGGDRPWYRKTWGRAAIGGAAVVIVSGIVWAVSGDDTVNGGDFVWLPGSP